MQAWSTSQAQAEHPTWTRSVFISCCGPVQGRSEESTPEVVLSPRSFTDCLDNLSAGDSHSASISNTAPASSVGLACSRSVPSRDHGSQMSQDGSSLIKKLSS